MPLVVDDKAPAKFPDPEFLTLTNFKRGVITLVNQANLPKNAVADAKNLILVEDGVFKPRPGIQWFGTVPLLPTASAPTATKTTGTALGIGVYDYVVTFVNANGETTIGSVGSVTTTSGSQDVNLTAIPIGPGGTIARNIYRTKVGGSVYFLLHQLADNTTTTYSDTTVDASLSATEPPINNTAFIKAMNGFNYYDTGEGTHIICVGDGNVFRSEDDAQTWTICSGYTLNTTTDVNMVQYNSYLYLTNGVDIIVRYDGSTTLQTYTVLTTPVAPTIAATGLSGSSYTVYYKISAVSEVGFSIASAAGSISIGKDRANFNATTDYLTLTLPSPQTTQTRFDIFFSEDNLNFYYLDSIVSSAANPQTSYKDDGSAIIIPSTTAPTTNTTQGPTVQELKTVGLRLYGVRDPNYPYRIWFSSGSSPLGSFSDGYDGGYLDWQLGGKYFPVDVEDYRDGKGTNLATVWLDSADSQGAIIQMSLGTLTVGNLSVTVPSAYQLPGSRGTPAPRSVVNVLNDYVFYNSQAFYNLGNRTNLLQILSTDETSANIRPTVRTINPVGEAGICSIYYDSKIYISVPYGIATENNATIIYDTELQSWLPNAYDVGFKQFLRYTDNAKGIHHLLALKPGDNQLTEMGTLYTPSATIRGDYGEAFQTNFLSGLYSLEKDRYDFQYVQEMEYEFSNPQDIINIELLGIDHASGFGSVKTAILNVSTPTVTNAGWDTQAWDTRPWDYTDIVIQAFSETSTKRYTVVNRELNAVQWHISTDSLNADYIIRSLQTWGTDTQDAHPSKWRITAV